MTQKSQHCLVAAKDKTLCRLLAASLTARGCSVIERRALGDVLSCLNETEVDLLVLADELTDTDGYSALRNLQSKAFKGLVVFVSEPFEDAAVYGRLKDELGVALVLHLPLDEKLLELQLGILLRRYLPQSQESEQIMDDTIGQMKERYAKMLPLRTAAMEQLAAEIKTCIDAVDEKGAKTALLELVRLCHNLKGSGETYGFSEISAQAGKLEAELKAICKSSNAIESSFVSEIPEKLASLSRLAGQSTGKQIPGREPDPGANLPLLLLVSSTPAKRITESTQIIQANSTSQASHFIKTRLDIDAILIEADALSLDDCLNFIRETRDADAIEGLPFGLLLSNNGAHRKADASHAGVSLVIDPGADDQELKKAIDYLISIRPDGRSKVLVVDDDEDFLSLVAEILRRQGMLVRPLQDSTKALETVQEWSPDLIMLDVNMPLLSGFELCRAIRTDSRFNDTPIIFLTSQTDMPTRIAAFESGADDYLPKPVAEPELISRVKVRLDKARMVKRSLQLDPLTGLLLRKPLMDKLETFKHFSNRNNSPFSVALVDIDHFKKINDTHGHLIGDEVLKTFAKAARSRFRAEDLRGRWGGEEFILAFRGENRSSARKIVERFLLDVKAMTFKNEQNENFNVSFSSGVAEYPTESSNVSELLKIADGKLYKAKALGRSRVLDE